MSFQKLILKSYYVGGRHRSATTNIYRDVTSEGSKVLNGHSSIFKKKKGDDCA